MNARKSDACFVHAARAPPRIRAFLDHLREELNP